MGREAGPLPLGPIGECPWDSAGAMPVGLGVGSVVLVAAGLVLLLVLGRLAVRLVRSPFPAPLAFWWLLNDLYCRWWFRLEREGECPVPARGPVIVVANHRCTIDPLLLIASVPHRKLSFLIAEEYSDLPVFRRLTRMVECIPVKRDGGDVAGTKAALRHLKAGKTLGIFLEGRIPAPGQTAEPKDGAVLLALRTGALVVPAHVAGTRYDPGIARPFFRRHRARVRFGRPIDLRTRCPNPKPDRQEIARLSADLMREIEQLAAPRPSPPNSRHPPASRPTEPTSAGVNS